jgi:hypothetical protein
MDSPAVREVAAGSQADVLDAESVECPGSSKPAHKRVPLEERRAKAEKSSPGAGDKSGDKQDGKEASGPAPRAMKHAKLDQFKKAAEARRAKASEKGNADEKVAAADTAAGGKADTRSVSPENREVAISTVRMSAPASWRREPPPAPFILAAFSLKRSAGDSDDADVTVTPAASDKKSVQTLRAQLQEDETSGSLKLERLKIDGRDVFLIDSTDTDEDADGKTSAAPTRTRSLNATVFIGSKAYFINCTGPEKTVGERSGEFRDFLKTMKTVD